MDNYNAVICSYQVFQEALGMSGRTVSRAIKYLKDNGFIYIYKSGSSNVYIANKNLVWRSWGTNYNDSAQKTPAVRKNVRGMNAPITNNATIIPTGFSSGIVGFSWPDVLQNAVIRCIALLFQEKHFR